MKEFFGAISGLKNKTANTKVSKDYHTKLINWWSHKKHGVKRNLRKKTTICQKDTVQITRKFGKMLEKKLNNEITEPYEKKKGQIVKNNKELQLIDGAKLYPYGTGAERVCKTRLIKYVK